jgi:O-antigen ligase
MASIGACGDGAGWDVGDPVDPAGCSALSALAIEALASLLAAGGLVCGGGAVVRSDFWHPARLRAAMATAVAVVGSVRFITMTSPVHSRNRDR